MLRFACLLALFGALAVAPAAAHAMRTGSLFGVDTISDDTLLRIDPATGAATPVGSIGFDAITSLAFDPASDTLFGVSSFDDDLLAINPQTGVGSVVGGLGIDEIRISSLAFNTRTGVLFGATGGGLEQSLVSIDTSTGQAAVVGSLGTLVFAEGLAYDERSDTLFAFDNNAGALISIDQTTAAVTTLSQAPSSLATISGLAFDSGSQTLFGLNLLPLADDELVSIDPLTGDVTAVGPLFTDGTTHAVGGLTFAPDSIPVPEPSALGLLSAGALSLSRRRTRS